MIIVMIIAFGAPLVLSVFNIISFTSKQVSPSFYKASSTLTVFVGGLLYLLLYGFGFNPAGDWYEQIYDDQTHYTISTDYMPTLVILAIVGLVGYFTLLFSSAEKLPPLVSVFCVAAVIMINILHITHAVQISNHYMFNKFFFLFYVYHANLLLISATTLRKHIREMLAVAKNKGMDKSENVKYRRIYALMTKFSHYSIVVFVALFLFFPMHYDGHYLCTVAAGGHRKVVKPLRYGTRLGETIIVNRQLCVANAFEELIHDKLSRFHKVVRTNYDKYGYPLSKHITTPLRADIVYFVMKPLEWIFVFVLYLFDKDPEKRISRQYEYRSR